MATPQYQLPQQPPPSQPTGQLLNTQPAPQMAADKNVTSLSMPTNEAMTNLAFTNNMLHHLIQYKASKGKPASPTPSKDASQTQELQENPQEEAQETPQQEQQEQPQDTSKVETSIKDLQNIHEKEIAALRAEMNNQGMKKEYEAKISELEAKHKKNITDLQNEVKAALNENE
jgi:flagellar biosynthesis GTPase FlhF